MRAGLAVGGTAVSASLDSGRPLRDRLGHDTGWADTIGACYTVIPDIVYVTLGGQPQKLDFYRAVGAGPHPTALLFHGGGWMAGDKAGVIDGVLPWLARGWNVANANYRLGSTTHAPAAVEDARCAFRWLNFNAAEYAIDMQNIVLTGYSAGGHLALMAALLPDSDPLDYAGHTGLAMPPELVARRISAGSAADWWGPLAAVRAVVNFYGITDLAPLLAGDDTKTYALAWVAARAGDRALVRSISPCTHVRPGLPPIISVHGDADRVVPIAQARSFHAALSAAAVRNELVTIVGGGHGHFAASEYTHAWGRITDFLKQAD